MALPCVRHSVALRVKFYIVFVLVVSLLSFHVRYVRAHVKYDRGILLQLGEMSYRGFPGTGRPTRKRGRRGGGGRRLRRLFSKGRLTLPIILFANVQSLANKMDDPFSRMATQRYIQDCSVLFCETWLGQRTPDDAIKPAGYTVSEPTTSLCNAVKLAGYAHLGAPIIW